MMGKNKLWRTERGIKFYNKIEIYNEIKRVLALYEELQGTSVWTSNILIIRLFNIALT